MIGRLVIKYVNAFNARVFTDICNTLTAALMKAVQYEFAHDTGK